MQAYVTHLLEDLYSAHLLDNYFEKSKILSEEDLESHFKEIDQYIQGGNEFAFFNHCGLKSIDFPPAEKLNATQLGILIKAFHNIMKSWNLEVAFLGDLPINRRYARLVGQIDEPAFIFQHGVYCQDFCTEVQTVVV